MGWIAAFYQVRQPYGSNLLTPPPGTRKLEHREGSPNPEERTHEVRMGPSRQLCF